MYQYGGIDSTNPVLLGERPSFESQLPLAKFAFTKYWKICMGTLLDSEDIYQTCCIGLWRAYTKFDWQKRKAWTTYAMRAIRNELSLAASVYKARRRVPENEILSIDYVALDDDRPAIILSTNNDFEDRIIARQTLYQRIKKMSRDKRRIIYMHYLLGMTLDEIAQQKGTSRQAIQQVLKRAEKELKIFLTKNNPIRVATRT